MICSLLNTDFKLTPSEALLSPEGHRSLWILFHTYQYQLGDCRMSEKCFKHQPSGRFRYSTCWCLITDNGWCVTYRCIYPGGKKGIKRGRGYISVAIFITGIFKVFLKGSEITSLRNFESEVFSHCCFSYEYEVEVSESHLDLWEEVLRLLVPTSVSK